MDRRQFIQIAGTGAALMSLPGSVTMALEGSDKDGRLKGCRPNIILVLTDDQGYGDLACHGHPYLKTPNLDKLYSQSTRLTDYHVSPTCAPTRSAIMTGRAPFKNGITHTILERERMTLQATTIAEVLRSAGYTTGIFGKWHLGDEEPYQPCNRGFDEMFIHGAGGIGQAYPGSCADVPGNSYFDPIIRHNDKFVQTQGYCTDVFFRQALGWVKDNHERPFFAYISTNAPHAPFHCPEKYVKMYENKVDRKHRAAFYGMVTNIDENVGLLLKKLDEWGLSNDTLVVFMTDNGTSAGDYNAGMRGRKGTVREGGCRVPAFFRLPGRIAAGRDVDRLTRHIDIFPTFAELAGAEYDVEVDGRSLLDLLVDPDAQWEDRYTFFHLGRWGKEGVERWRNIKTVDPDEAKYRSFAVRNERWRLVNGSELYDIQKDPGEKENVIEQNFEIAKDMVEAYDKWWDEVRPLMVNEDVPLAEKKPYHVKYRKQKDEVGIPRWKPPKI
ncbi:Arylsulfatase precursor [Anaerohalosphaera lusitana]|uniref:Arylsulfatase n=1 Tax=Anaerohalosphaera lusitana TaxID=1936003 RepID=A0A1U9NH07_9BACT|nr:arylsulfatase [Anaerohalosphaera lusitana]AQT67024.1 Arylsulfatase precursor [Anaerohalosphaera lusitana]